MRHRSVFCFVLFALVGVTVGWAATSYNGIGLSYDSIKYILIARNFSEGRGVTVIDGSPLINQPPFYPVLLGSMTVITGIDPLDLARGLNALLLGLLISSVAWCVYRLTDRSLLSGILGGLWILFSIPVVEVAFMAWTELLFILLTFFCFISVVYYTKKPQPRWLVLSILLAASAILTRYIGYTVIFTGCLVILIGSAAPFRQRVLQAGIFGAGASGPLALWLIRNWYHSGSFSGERPESILSLGENLRLTRAVILDWFRPDRLNSYDPLFFEVGGSLFLGVVAVLIWRAVKNKENRSFNFLLWAAHLIFMGVYLLALIISASRVGFDQINDRFLSPIYLSLGLIVLILFYRLSLWGKEKYQPASRLLLAGLFALGLVFPIYAVSRNLQQYMKEGLEGETWKTSATVHYLTASQLDKRCTLYSNRPDVINLLTLASANTLPPESTTSANQAAPDLSDLKGQWPESLPACIVWFFDDKGRVLTVDELEAIVETSVIEVFPDGTIYQVVKRR
ncbi:MAG: glycosyltransferase family 39 protein [Chloroflexi bacterium]|nr:glycosyltransferase family 39 protein [Chloroflexota bacterium]